MSEPVRIVLTMDGGIIQNIETLGVPLDVLVIDHEISDFSIDEGNKDQVVEIDGERAFAELWSLTPEDKPSAERLADLAPLFDRLNPSQPVTG